MLEGYKDFEIEILQWGKILEKNEENTIIIPNVSKIYEPEPDRIPITYVKAKFTEIPEWLFSKKITSKVMSRFVDCKKITNIPENLFKNCLNAEKFEDTFNGCAGLTSIPEGLFKNNVNVIYFGETFRGCTGLTSIPEGLFKNNVNVNDFNVVFEGCIQIQNIPEDIIELAKKIGEKGGRVSNMFSGCTSASNYNSLPNYLKQH